MGVSGVGGSGGTQALTDEKVNDAKATQQTDRAQLEAQLDRQAQGPSAAQMSGFIAQMQAQVQQAQAQQTQQAGGQNAYDSAPEGVKMKANAIAKQVVSQLMSMMPSAQNTAGSGSSDPGASEQGANAGSESGGLGSTASKMDAQQVADQQIQDAAKVAVYGDIYKMLQKMQNTRETKASLDEKINSIEQAMANHKPGDKFKVPVWEYDDKSGQVKFKGYKEMTYEEAGVMRDKLRNTKDSLSEINQEDMFWLQRSMDQKSQLESMISNTMKASSDAQGGIVSNSKAS